MPAGSPVKIPNQPVSVQVSVKAGYAGIGSYHLRLWSPQGNTILMDKSGTFLTPDDDDYTLPLQAKDLNGYYVESLASISQAGAIENWSHVVTVSVPGQAAQPVTHSDHFASGATITDQLIIQLEF